jgi:hypothetical protein
MTETELQAYFFIHLGSTDDAHRFLQKKQGLGWLEPKPCLVRSIHI